MTGIMHLGIEYEEEEERSSVIEQHEDKRIEVLTENNVYNIAIDADSLVYKALYRHGGLENIELAYAEVFMEIGKICQAIFNDLYAYKKGDKINYYIVLSPRKSFRNDIYLDYKANRKRGGITGIKELKRLLLNRLGNDVVKIVKNVEADDLVMYYAKKYGWLVAAIDKDIVQACPTFCYNYNKMEWSAPMPEFQIEKWYLMQTLMGDSADNIKGANKVGPVKAKEIVDSLLAPTFQDIVEYFDTEYDAILNHQLVRMDQFDGEGIKLWMPT